MKFIQVGVFGMFLFIFGIIDRLSKPLHFLHLG